MNVLMFNYEYPPLGGGGGVMNKELAEELSHHHNVVVVTSRFNGQRMTETINNVEIFRVPVLFRKDKNAATIISMLSYFPNSLRVGYRLLKTSGKTARFL